MKGTKGITWLVIATLSAIAYFLQVGYSMCLFSLLILWLIVRRYYTNPR